MIMTIIELFLSCWIIWLPALHGCCVVLVLLAGFVPLVRLWFEKIFLCDMFAVFKHLHCIAVIQKPEN